MISEGPKCVPGARGIVGRNYNPGNLRTVPSGVTCKRPTRRSVRSAFRFKPLLDNSQMVKPEVILKSGLRKARSVFSSFFPPFNNDEWCIPDCEPRECVHTFHIADTSTTPPDTHTAVGSLLSSIGVWRANRSHPSRFRSISSKGSSCPTKNSVLTELVEFRRPSL